MRIVLATLCFIAAGAALDMAKADPYRWCADYGGLGGMGGTNCYFVTQEQCRWAISGVGGWCRPNGFYDGIPQDGAAPARRAKKRAQHRG
jgi:hypothetical protein